MSKISVKKCIPGIRVIRGKDWDYGDQDGGEGNTGVMKESKPKGWVTVLWEEGDRNSYRIGEEDKYDLYFADDKDALLQEAMERFPVDTVFSNVNLGYKCENVKVVKDCFTLTDDGRVNLKNNCASEMGEFTVYKNGKWAERTDVKSAPKEKVVEVFPRIYVGDIVVSLEAISYRKEGDLFKVLPKSYQGCLYYHEDTCSKTSTWRSAALEEVHFYSNGGKNIYDMNKQTPESSLLQEAMERYPVGTKFIPAHLHTEDTDSYCIATVDSGIRIDRDGDIYAYIGDSRWVESKRSFYGNTASNRKLYDADLRKWAPIIKDKEEDLTPLEKCKQMFPVGTVVETIYENMTFRETITQKAFDTLQDYSIYGEPGNISSIFLRGWLYREDTKTYAKIISTNSCSQLKPINNGNESTSTDKQDRGIKVQRPHLKISTGDRPRGTGLKSSNIKVRVGSNNRYN